MNPLRRRSFLASLAALPFLGKRLFASEPKPNRIVVTNGDGAVGNPGFDLMRKTSVPVKAPGYSMVSVDTQGRATASRMINVRQVGRNKYGQEVEFSRKFVTSFGDGKATRYKIHHGLGVRDVQVSVWVDSGTHPYDQLIHCEVGERTDDTVTLGFNCPPAQGAYRVVVIG